MDSVVFGDYETLFCFCASVVDVFCEEEVHGQESVWSRPVDDGGELFGQPPALPSPHALLPHLPLSVNYGKDASQVGRNI